MAKLAQRSILYVIVYFIQEIPPLWASSNNSFELVDTRPQWQTFHSNNTETLIKPNKNNIPYT